jgi:TPR repeat protein
MHFNGHGGLVEYAAAAKWWKRAAEQGHAHAFAYLPDALNHLFPSGMYIPRVCMPALRLNGMRGVVDATPDGKIVYLVWVRLRCLKGTRHQGSAV